MLVRVRIESCYPVRLGHWKWFTLPSHTAFVALSSIPVFIT
jgi:hypothetical protein